MALPHSWPASACSLLVATICLARLTGLALAEPLEALPGDAASTPRLQSLPWHSLGDEPELAISGLTVVSITPTETVLLAVHDNKDAKAEQPRIGLIIRRGTAAPEYLPLAWPKGTVPVDLESVTATPGWDGRFLAVESSGRNFSIMLDVRPARADAPDKKLDIKLTVEPRGGLPAPAAGREVEAFDFQVVGNRLLAVWAYRGSTSQPALLQWCEADPASLEFRLPARVASLRVPWPTEFARHISDLKIDSSGLLYVSATSDPGDEGPFSSAVYVAGAFDLKGDTFQFQPSPAPVRLYPHHGHKVEALVILPGSEGGIALGSDDEAKGGSVCFLP